MAAIFTLLYHVRIPIFQIFSAGPEYSRYGAAISSLWFPNQSLTIWQNYSTFGRCMQQPRAIFGGYATFLCFTCQENVVDFFDWWKYNVLMANFTTQMDRLFLPFYMMRHVVVINEATIVRNLKFARKLKFSTSKILVNCMKKIVFS